MINVYSVQPDGTVLVQPDGSPILLYSYQPTPPQASGFTAADYRAALLALLPSGPVWPRDLDATLPAVIGALAPAHARLSDRAAALLQDAPAGALLELLPEWEATLGLPDECAGPEPTIALRRAQVLARIGAQGGQSVPYMVALAGALGFQIKVEEFTPSRYGEARYDDVYADPEWAHTWRVTVLNSTVTQSRYGDSYYADPYTTWGNRVLECELRRVAPAHTLLLFGYAAGGPAAGWDQGAWDRDAWAA